MVAKKIKIDIDFSQDNTLVAISCHKKDYWLAFQLNAGLKYSLKKIDDFQFYHAHLDHLLPYPIYYHHDLQTGLNYYLVGNYHPEGKLFSPLKNADYFLLLNGDSSTKDMASLISELKRIDGILHAYIPETKPLKEYGNFLSDLELHMIDSVKK